MHAACSKAPSGSAPPGTQDLPPRTTLRGGAAFKFDALLISYETMLKEQNMLARIPFSAAIFDEAHKLKAAGSSTRKAAMRLDIKWKLLLTGGDAQPEGGSPGSVWRAAGCGC